jgi:formamidopyrimidine-DNA glycosylase
MPELPEVETLRRSLIKTVLHQNIISTEVFMGKIVSAHGTTRLKDETKIAEFVSQTKGRTIVNITRRAKNLIFELNDGYILVHLKMTGQLIFSPVRTVDKHTHIMFELSNGFLSYKDIRQFGYVLYFKKQGDFQFLFNKLGAEPLEEIDLWKIYQQFKKKKQPIKKVLLDQTVIVGVGNIYSDEICFRSGIRPHTKASDLSIHQVTTLLHQTKKVLKRALETGGSSISNYMDAEGIRGTFALEHQVYGRAGKSCYGCQKILLKTNFAGRSSVFCPTCQS